MLLSDLIAAITGQQTPGQPSPIAQPPQAVPDPKSGGVPLSMAPRQMPTVPDTEPTAPTMPAPNSAPAPAALAPKAAAPPPNFGPTLGEVLANVGAGFQGKAQVDYDAAERNGNATYQALIAKGLDPTSASAAARDPAILQQIAGGLFGPKTPVVLPAGSSIVGNSPDGTVKDLTPASVASRAKLEPGQIVGPDGKITYQPGFLDATRAKRDADGKTYTASDKAAINTADNRVQTGKQLLADLSTAKGLNTTAWDGYYADAAPVMGGILGDHAPQGAQDNQNLTNVVMNSILPSLKQIFPGRVTNTDVQLMKDLQGIGDKPAKVRGEIIDRAIARASTLNTQMQSEADELRGGTYYQPGGGAAVTARPDDSPDASAPPPATTATPHGAPEATRVVKGVTYAKIKGQWYQQ